MTERSLSEWLQYMESLTATEIDLGLERVAAVADVMACRRPAPLTLMVAGTNGKGTTSALLSALLQAQGLQVGVYSSPHLQRYNERVQINGEQITDAELVASFERVEQARGDTGLTYFEFGTLSALEFFARQSLDVCILEVGLGGRLDAVNVADADACVVTSIGLDHQAWLGNSVDDIAYEKCAIARSGRPLICGQPQPPERARATVNAQQGVWLARGEAFDIVASKQGYQVSFSSAGEEMSWSIPQVNVPYHNVATALQALAAVQRLPSEAVARQLIAELRVPGRLQQLALGQQQWFLDVAHNPQAMAHLAQVLPQVDGVIFSALEDKPVADLVALLPQHQQLLLAGLDVWRGLSAEQLAERVQQPVDGCFDSVAEALQFAVQQTHRRWLVAGSFYTVEQALNWMEERLGHGAAS
jgi:dihydrofolate synthase/folylpolyglutamate synthase